MELRLALTGFGNVGQGVAQLLRDYATDYEEQYGVRLTLTGVADRRGAIVRKEGLDPKSLLDAKRSSGTVASEVGGIPDLEGDEFLDRAGADVLLEAASTSFEDAEPGWTYTRAAFDRGMDVVLASKGALVLYFDELMERARNAGREVRFAATVGAPLPVLELHDRVLIGARITGFEGILNATCNTILTSMESGASYEEGVSQAQAIGIAETDPTLDVDGWDAAAKAVIVANSVLGASLRLDDVKREGIRGVTQDDLSRALAEKKTIKLISRAVKDGSEVRASVQPELRAQSDDLGRLRNHAMGLVYQTELLGRATATMEGTGGLSTALTMLRDVVNLSKDRR